ncbi:STE24 endopeptidase, partial [Sphingomonas sp. NFR04]|uniref:M48 family metalloprotease n=1 Tax=Sphingomonas sp. NFR04 TaxID=1566283 RepID=UPI0008F1AC1B
MNAFDPLAATAQYLHMIDPVREARAIAYTQGSHWLLLWGWLLSVAIDLVILRSGLLVRLRDRIQRNKPRPNLAAFACVTVFILSAAVLRLPWSIYADWARERSYGLSSQDMAGWLTQNVTTTIFTSILGGLVAIAIYALMRRTGPRWWIWSSAVCAVLAFLALAVAPLLFLGVFNDTRPAPAGPVRRAIEGVAQEAGMPASKIVVFNGSKQSNNYTASVVGGPGFATIVLSDTMLTGEVDQSEIRAVVAHEIGHYKHNHLLILAAVVAVLAGAGLWLVDRMLGAVPRSRDRQSPLVQDPAAIPLAHLVFITFTLLTTP